MLTANTCIQLFAYRLCEHLKNGGIFVAPEVVFAGVFPRDTEHGLGLVLPHQSRVLSTAHLHAQIGKLQPPLYWFKYFIPKWHFWGTFWGTLIIENFHLSQYFGSYISTPLTPICGLVSIYLIKLPGMTQLGNITACNLKLNLLLLSKYESLTLFSTYKNYLKRNKFRHWLSHGWGNFLC